MEGALGLESGVGSAHFAVRPWVSHCLSLGSVSAPGDVEFKGVDLKCSVHSSNKSSVH